MVEEISPMKPCIHLEIIHLKGKLKCDAVLTELGDYAISRKWARMGYCQALIQREQDFPTGLQTKTIGVAIPHADPHWVKEPAVIAGILPEIVNFHNMENSRSTVPVQLVLLLSLPSEIGHMELLRALVNMISDDSFLKRFIAKPSKDRLLEFLRPICVDLEFQ